MLFRSKPTQNTTRFDSADFNVPVCCFCGPYDNKYKFKIIIRLPTTCCGDPSSSAASFLEYSKMPPSSSAKLASTFDEPLQKQTRAQKHTSAVAAKKSKAGSTGIHDKHWNEMYQRLIVYKNEHDGDTKVPRTYKRDRQLANWVHAQRKKHTTMPSKRVSLLNSIEFDWGRRGTLHTDAWDIMYQRLLAYQRVNGNTNVPYRYDEDRQIGRAHV